MNITIEELKTAWAEDLRKEFNSKKRQLLRAGAEINKMEAALKENNFREFFEKSLALCKVTDKAYGMTDIARELV